MFELTAGTIDRPFRDAHAGATAFSIASHVIVLGGVAALILFAVTDVPRLPTPMMAFVAELPAALPPPPPPPPPPTAARAQRETQPARPAPSSGPTFIAPAAVPTGIQRETAIDPGDEGGVAGGVEGGLPGGVIGGIPGGLVMGPPPPPPPRKAVRVGGEIQQPALLLRVEPKYPLIAIPAKVTGTVILEATVNERGEVTNVDVLRSIPLLDPAAVAAIKQWRYQPLLMNGVASPFILVVTLTFSLR